MSISSNLTKLTTDITNAYTSIENKLPKILPEGYTQVEYIESTGTQYINTGVANSSTWELQLKMAWTSKSPISGDPSVYCSNGINNNMQIGITPSTGVWTVNGGDSSTQVILNKIYDVSISQSTKNLVVDGTTVMSRSSINTTTPSNIILFAYGVNANTQQGFCSEKVYSAKIYDNNILVRNLIPCYRNSDNIIGMYDTVNDVFYTNQGTGTFLKGYDTAIGMDKNTNNLSTAIDSIEVIEQATAEGESLSLVNTKAMPYKDYVVEGKSTQEGTPSPDYPSEIHSVADDVNLFNVITATANQSNYVLNNDGTITNNKSWGNDGRTFFNNILLNAGTHIISYVPNLSGTTKNIRFSIKNIDSSTDIINQSISITNLTKQTYSFSLSSNTNIAICIMPNGVNDGTLTLDDIKLQEGSIATPYSPYNQGTVTIKQENIKNYLNWDKFIDYSNWSNSDSPGYKCFEITGLNINKTYTLCRIDTAGYGEQFKYAGFSKYRNNSNMFIHSTDESRNLQSISDTSREDGTMYINLYGVNSQNDLDQYISIIKKCWVIEGTEYQEYVNNDYTIQTSPLRSLPNGVKDTIEADGIHRRVGRVVLDGSENNWGTVGDNRYYLPIQDKRNLTTSVPCNIVSNYFKSSDNAGDSILIGYMTEGYYTTGNKNIFFNYNGSNNDLAGFQTWLSTHNTEVLYQLAEEIIEPLTQNQATTMLDIIKTGSYEGTTNIYTDEDVKPTMKVDYYKKG